MKIIQSIKYYIASTIGKNSFNNRALLAFALFISLCLFAPFINILFEIKPEVTNFSQHIISNASINNLDVGKRVSLYNKTIFSVLFLAALLFLFLKILTKNSEAKNKLLNHLFSLSVIGILVFFSGLLLFQSDTAVFFILISLFFIFIEIRNTKQTDILVALFPVFVSFPTTLFLYTFLKNKNFFDKITPELKFNGNLLSVDFQALMFVFLLLGFSFIGYVLKNRLIKKEQNDKLLLAGLPIVFTPILLSFLLESLNILNIRFNIIYNYPLLLFGSLLLGAFLVSVYLLKSNRIYNSKIVENSFLVFCLLGYIILIAQPYRFMVPSAEFFEAANQGISVDHFFKYGSIPIVETFDAHMMSQQFFSYLYVFLNGYEPWSHSAYIQYFYIIEVVILFYILKSTLGKVNSLYVILCVPIISLISNEFIAAGIAALCVIKLISNQKPKNNYLFWGVGILLCLYKLDIGYSALLSGIIAYFLFNKIINNKFELKQFLKSALILIVPIILLFILLCLVKSINPIQRIQEFLLAALSDQNWGIAQMGNTSNYLFRVSYYILPLLVSVFAVSLLFKMYLRKEFLVLVQNNAKIKAAVLFFFFFFLFFIFNAQRGIVFHNFEYGNILRITSTIPIALLFMTLISKNKNKLIYFSLVFLGLFLFMNSANPDFKNRTSSLLSRSIDSNSFHEKFLEMRPFNGSRLNIPFDQSEINFFKNFLDVSLALDKTYYDFSSTNLFYVLTNRKNPSYLNQVPLMLNGDKAQDVEISTLTGKKIEVVLMPIKNNIWHGITGSYVDLKYYKIAEYVYANYSPLFRSGTFDVYVLKSKKTYFDDKLKSLGQTSSTVSIEDFNFLKESGVTKNNINLESTATAITIKPTGASAYFIGIMDYLRKNNKLAKDNGAYKLNFKFNASSAGTLKIYYNVNPTDTFSEERAKDFPIMSFGDNEINMDFAQIPSEIMIAVNVESIAPKLFQFVSDTKGSVNQPEKIDYYIGSVPKLWAENSDNLVFNSVKPLSQPVEESTASIDSGSLNSKKVGVFAFLEIESPSDITATIDVSEKSISKAMYGFNILAGKHQYAVRVSNGFYWWNTTNPKITFKAENSIKILKFALVTEDGKTSIPFKSNGLTLSNLNDENWKNGCSLSYNMVALDYSPAKEKLLVKFKKMQLVNNRMVTIKGYYVSGSYINVTLLEDLQEYNDLIAFPNTIEFVN